MNSAVRIWSGVVCILALSLVPTAGAQSDALQAAIGLFEQQQYLASQEALLKVDREELVEHERAQLDELLTLVDEAIRGNEKSKQSLTAAQAAYDAGDWKIADGHYAAVMANRYAELADRQTALDQRARIAEKLTLAEAARPTDPVEVSDPPPLPERVEVAPAEAAPEAHPAAPMEVAPMPAEGPRRLTPTAQLRMKDELLWQQAVAKAQSLADDAREAMIVHEYSDARKLADTALQTIEAARSYAEPRSKYETAKEAMVRLKVELQQAQQQHDALQAAQEREEIARRIEERRAQLEARKQETILQLFNSAEQLRNEKRFAEAAEVLRQILLIEPANAQARYQLEVAEDYESFAAQAQWYGGVHSQQRRSMLKAQESLIPWDYDVLYPKNWLELTAKRALQTQIGGAGFEDQELNRRLDSTIPEVRFDDTPFEHVVDFLTETTQTNISVDWDDLDNTLVLSAREKPVSIHLNNLKFRVVLKEVLSQVGGDVPLAFDVSDGLLRVATKEKLDRNKFIVTYDIRDLLGEVPQAPMPGFERDDNLGAVDSGGGGRGSLFSHSGSQMNSEYDRDDDTPKIEKIKHILRSTIEPDSWMEAGAGPSGGSIQDLNGQLLVYGTSTSQQQVVNLLGMLRETQALQISVEARFLDVVSNFLEQFGVDLDFVFNSGDAGFDRSPGFVDPFTGAPVLIPRQFSRIGAFATPPAFGSPIPQGTPSQPYGAAAFVPAPGGVWPKYNDMTPVSAQQSSLSLVDPTSISTGVPGSWAARSGLAPALNVSGSFLDNLQVDFLIRATQANSRSTILQAPRAVMTNGQAVEIQIQQRRDYVASLTPVVGEAVGLPQPNIDSIDSGISMWVQGVISSDRRYTTLSLSLLNVGEPEFDNYELQRASGNSPSIFVLLPRYRRVQFTTTVSVPDGGTVLLGGFKQVGEVEVDAGVPILNKTPILKRAFTNTTTVKDTRTLLIRVKSKILIQKEAEEEAFPTFTGLGN